MEDIGCQLSGVPFYIFATGSGQVRAVSPVKEDVR